MVNGITFSEQLITSENFAHFMYTFLNHANGVTKGCAISNANGKVYVQKGYFIVFGRMVQIIGTEEIPSPDVVSGQLYCKVVFEVDLSKENTAEKFIQGSFKTLTSTSGYPSVRKEDLDDTGKVYQMPWCQYVKQAGSINDFRDLREILDLNSVWSAISAQNAQYKGEFDDYFAGQQTTILEMIAELEGRGYATTAEFNGLSAEVAETKKSVSDGKTLVAAAITAKRVVTAATDTFARMAENIGKIITGSGNAQPADVRQGKTFTGSDGIEKAGTMPNLTANATVNHAVGNGTKVVFGDEAYLSTNTDGVTRAEIRYNGEPGYIEGNTLFGIEQSKMASAVGLNPDYMIDTYTVLGQRGRIPTINGVNITPQTYAQTVQTAWKRLSGNVEIAAVPLPPANVLKEGYRYWIGGGYVDGNLVDYSYLAVNQVPFDGASFSGVLAEGAEVCYADPSNYLRRDAPEITSNGLRMYTSTATNVYPHLCPKKSIDFSPFREVRITGKFTGGRRGAGSFKVELWNINVDKIGMLRNQAMGALAYNSVSLDYANTEYTCVLDVSGVSGQAYLTVMFSNREYLAWPDYFINRIEFTT